MRGPDRSAGLLLVLGLLVASAAAAPSVVPAAAVTSPAGVWLDYTRQATGAQVAVIEDVDLGSMRSLAITLESRVPTQLKFYLILPSGETRMRYVTLPPAALTRSLHLPLEAFDPEPSARWQQVPVRGALLLADVPYLRMIMPRGALRLADLRVSREVAPLPAELDPGDETPLSPRQDRMLGAWLGKALGGRAGMAGEGRDTPDWDALGRSGWGDLVPPDEYGFGPDDDSTLGVGALLLAERLGRLPRGREIAIEWMTRVSPEFQWKNGWEVLRLLRAGVEPPATGRGPLGQCLDARIRMEPWALLHPGAPAAADAMATRDASVSSFGAGLDDARFVARAMARAFAAPPLEELVRDALEGLGAGYRAALLGGFEARAAGLELRAAYARLRQQEYLPVQRTDPANVWVYSLPNAGLMGLALAYGDGDPVRTLRLASFLGWDSDCNAGTLGALMGAWKGTAAFPAGLRESLSDRLRVAVAGAEHWSLRRLALRTEDLAARLGAGNVESNHPVSPK